jgi:starch synthase
LPLYRSARTAPVALEPTGHRLVVPVGAKQVPGRLWQSRLPGSEVAVYLVEQPDYFERDDPARGRGYYQYQLPNGKMQDYPDNSERFIFFSRAVLEALPLLNFWPDVLHSNDWQTGLIPVYLRELYAHRDRYRAVRNLFTVHNVAHQGVFWHWDMMLTALDWGLFNWQQMEYYGHLNFMKAGIVFAEAVNTVSPRYAQEIQTREYGCGLETVLGYYRDKLFGIVNGIDYEVWDPATDRHIAAGYDAQNTAGKAACKAALQERLQLPVRPTPPLLGMVARLVEQKGLDLVRGAVGEILTDDLQLVVLGTGDPKYQEFLAGLQALHPKKVAVRFAFDEALAHQIEAGADLFLMPSRFEPAGLNQLYSLKYGTVPVVRETGGLADTVTDCTPAHLAAGTATGFVFKEYTAAAFREAVLRAVRLFREQPEKWRQLQQTGMRQDWSWGQSAVAYEHLYSRLRAPTVPGR